MTLLPLNPYTVSSLIASSFCVSVAAFAFVKGEATRARQYFSLVSLSVGIWTLFPVATSISNFPHTCTFLARAVYLAACLTPAGFLLLSGALVDATGKTFKAMTRISFILAGLFILLLPTPWFIAGVQRDGAFRAVEAGFFYHFYVAYFSIFFSYSFFSLYKAIQTNSGRKRNQLKYVLGAFFVGSLGGSLHFLAVYIHKEPFPHDVLIIAFVGILTYAIVKHRLMEVTLAARYGTIETLLGLFVGLPLAALTAWINFPLFTGIVILCLVLFGPRLFHGVRVSLTHAVDRLPVFRGRYARFGHMEIHFRAIASTKTLQEWASTVKDVAQTLFLADTIALLMKDEPNKRFIVRSSFNLDPALAVFLALPMGSPIVKYLADNQILLIAETATQLFKPEEREQVQENLNFIQGEVYVPIICEGTLHSVLVLGEKPNGEAYNDLELTSLMALSRAAEHALRVILSGLAQEQTTSIWAHDLIKPFTFKGSFHYLEEMLAGVYGPMSEEIKTALQLVLGDIQFVRQNLQHVLKPGLPESFNILPTDLTRVFTRLRENYTIESIKSRIHWRVDVPPEDIRVFCDWSMIEHRVLVNLIENAFRYTPADGTVELGYKILDGKFVGFVKDNGIGIRADDIPKLFAVRSQLKEGTAGLAGLGLFSAKSVVEAHKGNIWVESTFGKGATFYFQLPLASAPRDIA